MSFRWPHQYVVSGRGEFPTDMLCYDEADFATRSDELVSKGTKRRQVHIIGEVEPCVGRWESFGWTVDKINALARRSRR